MKEIFLYGGAGGHCKSITDVIELENIYQIKGIILSKKDNKIKNINYPILGYENDLKDIINKYKNVIVSIGQIKEYKLRKNFYENLKKNNAFLPVIKSPLSYCSKNSLIGEGTILMHFSMVNASVRVGNNCIINSKSLIEHDVQVGDNCHISTGAILNGGVKIGENTFIGSNSVIKNGVNIGREVIIGAGKIILRDISDGEIVK